MARIPLVRGSVDYSPRFCDKCGKQVIFGPVYKVTIGEQEFKACSFKCEKALKEAHNDSPNNPEAHVPAAD